MPKRCVTTGRGRGKFWSKKGPVTRDGLYERPPNCALSVEHFSARACIYESLRPCTLAFKERKKHSSTSCVQRCARKRDVNVAFRREGYLNCSISSALTFKNRFVFHACFFLDRVKHHCKTRSRRDIDSQGLQTTPVLYHPLPRPWRGPLVFDECQPPAQRK